MTLRSDPEAILATFELKQIVVLRLARSSDLPKLEWFGQYTHYRRLFQTTYEDQQQRRRLMLLAVVNDFPIGQVFIHLGDALCRPQQSSYGRGYLYALRVLEPFRGQGIGTRLIQCAEEQILASGLRWAVIAAAKDNPGARRLYERLGYVVYSEDAGHWDYTDNEGRVQHVHEPAWLLQKRLRVRAAGLKAGNSEGADGC